MHDYHVLRKNGNYLNVCNMKVGIISNYIDQTYYHLRAFARKVNRYKKAVTLSNNTNLRPKAT